MSKQVPVAPRRRKKARFPQSRDTSGITQDDQAIRPSTETENPSGCVELKHISLQENIRPLDGQSHMELLLESENSNWLDFTDKSNKDGSEKDMAEDFRRAELTQRGGGLSTPVKLEAGDTYKRTGVDETTKRFRPMTPVDSDSSFLGLLGNDVFTETHENDLYREQGRSGIQPVLGKRSNSLSLLEKPIAQDFKRSNTFSSRDESSTEGTSFVASTRASEINAPKIVVTLTNPEGSLVNLFEPLEETAAQLCDQNRDENWHAGAEKGEAKSTPAAPSKFEVQADIHLGENWHAGAEKGEAKSTPTAPSMFEVQADIHLERLEDVTSRTLDNMKQTKDRGNTVPRVRSISDCILGSELKNLAEDVQSSRAMLMSDGISIDENIGENWHAGAEKGEAKSTPTAPSMFEVQADIHLERLENVTSRTLDNMKQTKDRGNTVPRVRSISDCILGSELKNLAGQSEIPLDIQSSRAMLMSNGISVDENIEPFATEAGYSNEVESEEGSTNEDVEGDVFCVEVMDNETSKRCNLSGRYTLNVTFEGVSLFNDDGPVFCWLYKELEGFGFVKKRDIFKFRSIWNSQSGKGMFYFLTEEAEEINKSFTAHATPNCQLKVRRNSDDKSHANLLALVMKNLKKIRIKNLRFTKKKRNKISVSVISDGNIMPKTNVHRERRSLSLSLDSTHQYEEMAL